MSGYFEDQLNTDESVVELQQLMDSIARWLEINGFMNDQIHERFERMDEMLGNNYRNLLFLAEFSRGKSELINAIIFGMTGKRLLPSTPGRTTRCTTILQYEEDELPGVRLLPTTSTSPTTKGADDVVIEPRRRSIPRRCWRRAPSRRADRDRGRDRRRKSSTCCGLGAR